MIQSRMKNLRVPLKFLLGALLLTFAMVAEAIAFPELTRHGYASCTACHVAPNGGGVLTPYGRNLSRELLSTWGSPREAEVGHGLLPKAWMESLDASKVRLGGDARFIQTHRENKNVRAGQFFFMQANVEAAYDEGPWAVVVSLGEIEDPRGKNEFKLVSSKYYGLLRAGESFNLRAGRFSTAFGLNLADHTLSVRRPLGLGPEVDRDNLEASWIGEQNQYFLSLMETARSTSLSEQERAVVGRYERIINERSRVGGSFWHGDGGSDSSSSRFSRDLAALHTIVNLNKTWFLSAELDRQWRHAQLSSGTSTTESQYGFLRVHYEPIQGLWPLLQLQHERGDVGLDSSEVNKYGGGFNFFPRPHFEIFGIWNRVSRQNEWSDEAYLLLHYYL